MAGLDTVVDRVFELKETEWFIAVVAAVGIWLMPWFLIDVLGMVNEATGIQVGGYVGLPTLVLTFGIAVVGFNILLGYTGLLSFGHAAFFGVSAYAATLFSRLAESNTLPEAIAGSPILMVLVGVVAATLVAWPIGFLSIRRAGVYFAVLTLTFGQMLYYYSMGPGSWITNGDDGLSPMPNDLFGVMGLSDTLGEAVADTVGGLPGFLDPLWNLIFDVTGVYVLAALFTIVGVIVAHRIIRSPYGLIFEALGQNEERVKFVGLNVFRYKLMAFIISAAFTGVGGALYAIRSLSIIHPNTTLYWIVSGDFVIMNAIGGVGTLFGPLVGALVFEYIMQVLSGITVFGIPFQPMWRLLLGITFVLIVAFFQEGLYGGLRKVVGGIANRYRSEPQAGEPAASIEEATDGGEP